MTDSVMDDIAHDMVWSAMLHHGLPWRVERDWTHEVTAADGTVIAKCMTHERAVAIVSLAEKISAESKANDCDRCGGSGADPDAAEGCYCACRWGREIAAQMGESPAP